MKKIAILITGVILNISHAKATIQHWGYCTQFEKINSCQQGYTNDYDHNVYCSCSGEPPKKVIIYPGKCTGNPNYCILED